MELNPLVQTVQQNYFPPVSPHLTKNVSPPFNLLVACALPLPPNLPFGGKPVDEGRILSSSKKMPIFRTRKIPLTNTSFICSCSHCCCIIIFLTSGLIYRYIMLILISRGLLNLICTMTKAFNDQNSSKQNSQTPSPSFNAIWKTLLQLLLVFLFTPSLFISNFINFI